MKAPYHTVLIMAVLDAAAIQNVKTFIPPAKLGRLTDPEKIKEKEREHEDKCLAEAAGDPLLGEPILVRWLILKEEEQTGGEGNIQQFCTSIESVLGSPPQVILGPHPTTQMRQVQNCLLREGNGDLLDIFARIMSPAVVERQNIWREVAPDSRGDWQEISRVMGWLDGPVESTYNLAKTLGYI